MVLSLFDPSEKANEQRHAGIEAVAGLISLAGGREAGGREAGGREAGGGKGGGGEAARDQAARG